MFCSGERVHGGRLQDLRGAPEEDQPQHPLHYLWHQPALRFHRSGQSSARCVIEALSESTQMESVALTKSDRWQMVSFDDGKDKGYQAISAPRIHLGSSLKIKYQWCPTQLADLSCLVYQKSTNTYAPYNKVTIYFSRILKITLSRFTQQLDVIPQDWIKEKIYILLRRQASKAN